jgi:hypothetical protein
MAQLEWIMRNDSVSETIRRHEQKGSGTGRDLERNEARETAVDGNLQGNGKGRGKSRVFFRGGSKVTDFETTGLGHQNIL